MRPEYDFSQSRKNPYIKDLKKREITIIVEEETIEYFMKCAEDTGVPYQDLITLYLRDCAQAHQKVSS
jgi:predicted DNA binding CopG/RHH family protein